MAEERELTEAEERALAPEEWLLAAALVAMVGINFAGIVFRYWIHVSIPWAEEVEVALLIWLVFLGAGLTVVRRLHVGFPPLVERLPGVARRIFAGLGRITFGLLFAILVWFGVSMVRSEIAYGQTTPTLGWPEAVFGLALPVGGAIALIRLGLQLARAHKR